MTNNYSNITILLLGSLILAGVSYYLLNRGGGNKNCKESKTTSNNRPSSLVTLADIKKQVSTQIKSDILTDDVVSSMKDVVKHLANNLNALRDVTLNDELDGLEYGLFEGISLTLCTHGNEFLQEWTSLFMKNREEWSIFDYKQKAKTLLTIVEKCGVKSISENQIIWNNAQLNKYKSVSPVHEGDLCQVIQPYWLWNEKIFEKGMVITTLQNNI